MTNRNSNAHFELAPQMAGERSTFDRSCNIHTSFDVGQLVPFYIDEVLPGDSFQIQTSKVARLQTLIAPVMDNLYLDTYYFFVPNRLVWNHWKNFCGESEDAWIPDREYTVPQVVMPEEGYAIGTIADYMGVPVGIGLPQTPYGKCKINALPFRAYALIWNEWFRDENLQDPVMTYSDYDGNNFGNNEYGDPAKGGLPMMANKYHDYFTSALPAPQKGEDVSFMRGMVPVRTFSLDFINTSGSAIKFKNVDGTSIDSQRYIALKDGVTGVTASNTAPNPQFNVMPSNLYADLSTPMKYVSGALTNDTSLTINSLRRAFQIQRMLERDARGGSRYIELLKAHFGVTSPDARLQRPEYLGGNRIPLNIEQVINTTGNESMSLLPGDTSGWSQTSDVNYDVEKSFVEHGFIIGLMCARYDHTYQQGLERMWSRTTRYDFYWPALAHLGEQAVYTKELLYDVDRLDEVFGYQEAWAEYRYKPNYVTGSMRSAANNSLDIWHFADYYQDPSNDAYLSDEWIREDKSNVDRALAVKSDVENQIFMDIYVHNKCTRPMPLYSIPGLIDHF